MDYIDPVTTQEPNTTTDSTTNTSATDEKSPVEHDAATIKTEETIEKLESEIDKAYGLVETKFQELWSNASKNVEKIKIEEQKQRLIEQLNNTRKSLNEKTNELHVQENLKKIEESLKQVSLDDFTKSANKALDLLDSKLEIVENEASKYFGNFTSFLSSIVSVGPEESEEGEEAKKDVVFNSSLNQYNNYGTTRYETDLLNLHTSESFYLSEDLDVKEEVNLFNADSKTKEISELLEKYPNTLTKTMNDLVPVKVSYNIFWYRYFKNDDKLKDQEKKRKELLEKEDNSKKDGNHNDEEEEEFTWDDEDEEGEEEEEETEKTKKSETTKGSTKSGYKKQAETAGDAEDDWE